MGAGGPWPGHAKPFFGAVVVLKILKAAHPLSTLVWFAFWSISNSFLVSFDALLAPMSFLWKESQR